MSRVFFWFFVCGAVLAAVSCAGENDQTAGTATPVGRSIPPAVSVSPEPQDIALADPQFEALPGAEAYFGRIGGAVYRIEVPDQWNGTLALYTHGVRALEPEARAEDPPIRRHLIRTGTAWGSSSFSSTALIPGRAADETAALWDEFVRLIGRPSHTYVFGESMGGAAALISAEKYANRYDGALALCAYAGQSAIAEYMGDIFTAGAFVAGVTQADYDATRDDMTGAMLSAIFHERIIPALDDPQRHRLFEDILIAITGGPRAFDRLGVAFEESANWPRVELFVATRLAHNLDRRYDLAGVPGLSSGDFNKQVVRFAPDPVRVTAFTEGNEITGRFEVPVLTVHVSGDFYVPISNARKIRRLADDAGRGDNLAQVGVQGPRHCGFAKSEWERGLEALRQWVEGASPPESDDVLANDLADFGRAFTQVPRAGSSGGDAVPGAEDRVTLRGTVTVDGTALEGGTFWFMVLNDGLWHACSFEGVRPARGRYERVLVAESEVPGCGEPGASVVALTVREGVVLADEAIWPETDAAEFNVALRTGPAQHAAATFTRIYGSALDADGKRMPPGTAIEAYVGDVLCGETTVPPVKMQFDAPDEFALFVTGPAARAGCDPDATLEFRVNGQPVDGTLANKLDGAAYEITLMAK